MAKSFDYEWKHNGLQRVRETSVRFTKPLDKGMIFADLRNGRTYNVLAISQVKGTVLFKDVPKDVIHTSDAKPLNEEELATLRDVHKLDEDPDWRYVVL